MRLPALFALLGVGLSLRCAAADGDASGPLPAPCVGLACQVAKCAAGQDTVVRGRVTAPNGMDSIRQALVYVPASGQLSPLPQGLTCDLCSNYVSEHTVSFAYSNLDGSFEMHGVPAGSSIPIVVQKGRFRRLVTVSVQACQTQTLGTAGGILSLPKSRSEGDLPQMAVAAGDHDAIECVLRDLGLDPGEFVAAEGENGSPGNGAVHLYDNQTPGMPSLPGQLALPSLLTDRSRLFSYHVVFLDCSGTTYAQTLLADAQVRANLRDYVQGGGRLYATDWSYDFIQQVPEFSPFICFDDDEDCSVTTPHGFHTAVAHGGSGDPLTAMVDESSTGGQALAAWLAQLPSPVQPDSVPIVDLLPGWVMVQQTAIDAAHYPSTVWLNADTDGQNRPLTLSFDYPPQAVCGRALYSSYHTRERLPQLLYPAYCPYNIGDALVQERILEFLLFELSDCLGVIG